MPHCHKVEEGEANLSARQGLQAAAPLEATNPTSGAGASSPPAAGKSAHLCGFSFIAARRPQGKGAHVKLPNHVRSLRQVLADSMQSAHAQPHQPPTFDICVDG